MLFILILIIATIAQFFLPWWVIMLVPFLLTLWKGEKGNHSFFAGFVAIFISWLIYSLILHFRTDGILTGKIAEMMMIKSPMLLIFAGSLIGGLAGGIAAITGTYLKQLLLERI
ncbi:hypothetical protein [Solitalea koreensis]|uniref:Uncharacterized protein n=1 Tax=Solitalea koreensis TaxID=543615 RepID=A0A521E743_9SPHI|nr:hypothetical protein [Solitalea koreensis]SMO79000.1 hypothetical protein SAMN06265350_11132 [Solitalea koreensis]